MTSATRKKLWHLALRQQVLLDDAQGTTLRVARGTVWITLENDTRDVVIGDGESFTIDRPGRTIIEAQDRATVWVEQHSAARAFARRVASLAVHWARAAARAAARRRFVPHY